MIRGALIACLALCAGCLDWNFSSSGGLADGPAAGDGSMPTDAAGDGPPGLDGLPPAKDLASADLASLCPPNTIAFLPHQEIPVGAGPVSLAIADLNGDGSLDIASANQGGNNVTALLYSPGSGNYGSMTRAVMANAMLSFVVIGDFDHAGGLDVVTADENLAFLTRFPNTGDGMLGTPVNNAVPNVPYGLAVGNIDGDDWADIAVAHLNGGFVTVLINDHNGGFQPKPPIQIGQTATAVALADLDGDKLLDLVVADSDDQSIAILFGSGDGSFSGMQVTSLSFGPSLPGSLALADLDGDSRPELAVAQTGGAVSILHNPGGRKMLTSQADLMFMTTPTSVAFGDLDLDGHPDLVVTTADDSKVNVFQGAVGGKFPQQPASFATGASPQQVALADMNGDGRLDVVTANRDSNNVSLLLASCK